MYELVNTSLPNGLIAGTHGFSTVAMTKGITDILRSRLEALCAYTHRTSVHGAEYYQQNPINWFHVVLAQGEHVVGRVAPSDFDYTGRTNRLARLRVFGSAEMPSVGGAEILFKEKHWFTEPWIGEPHFLDEDKKTCGYLRMLDLHKGNSAPTWDSIFGKEGFRYAQQVAWQVERNLTAGGKPIYFKTSDSWDVSGEKLLLLFVEVIRLLPNELRAKVTFSTYPTSLPNGVSCDLRGIFDRDKIFDTCASTQAWIDCENAKIVNAELLPTACANGKTDKKSEIDKRSEQPSVLGINRTQFSISKTAAVLNKVQRNESQSYRTLIEQPTKGPDVFIVGVALASVLVLLLAGAFFWWMTLQNRRQMENSGAAAAVEAAAFRNLETEEEKQSLLEQEREYARRKAEEERIAKEAMERAEADRKLRAEQEADEAKQRLEKERAEENAKKAAEDAAEKATADAEARRMRETAFVTAHVCGIGMPPKPKTGLADTVGEVEPFLVYYYINGGVTLTNEVAAFKPISAPGNKAKIIDYALYVREPRLKLSLIERSPVVIWMSKGNVWFDWRQHDVVRSQWFKQRDKHDLQMEWFGVVDEVFEVWNKDNPVTYRISWGDAAGQACRWPTREFALKDAIDVVYMSEILPLKEAVEIVERDIEKNTNVLASVTAEISKIKEQIDEYTIQTNRLETLRTNLREEQDKKRALEKEKKFDKKAEAIFKDTVRRLRNEIADQEVKVQKIRIQSLQAQLQQCNQRKDMLEKAGKRLAEDLERKQADHKNALEDPDREKRVRSYWFSVTIMGVN